MTLQKFLSLLISFCILGYISLHGVSHAKIDLSDGGLHIESLERHVHGPLMAGHEESPFKIDHFHLDEFLKRPSKSENLRSKSLLLSSIASKSALKLVKMSGYCQSIRFQPGLFYSDPIALLDLPLRI